MSTEKSKFSSMFASAFAKKKTKNIDDEYVSEKRKRQKLDYEATRERGIVPGWKTEFPWLWIEECNDDQVIFCTVRLYMVRF